MSNQPFFSIITICYNEANNIRNTCESVIGQLYKDFEWIVIDGGSTDGTLDILNDYKDRIGRLISERDSGIYNAMNKGVLLSSGKYLLFMNGGDCFASNDTLLIVSQLPEMDLIYGDSVSLKEGVEHLTRSPNELSNAYLMLNGIPHQSCYFKRALFEKYGSYDESFRICSDYELIVRFVYRYKASSLRTPTVLSLVNRGGVSRRPEKRFERKFEAHKIRKKYFFKRYMMTLDGIKWQIRLWRFGL